MKQKILKIWDKNSAGEIKGTFKNWHLNRINMKKRLLNCIILIENLCKSWPSKTQKYYSKLSTDIRSMFKICNINLTKFCKSGMLIRSPLAFVLLTKKEDIRSTSLKLPNLIMKKLLFLILILRSSDHRKIKRLCSW